MGWDPWGAVGLWGGTRGVRVLVYRVAPITATKRTWCILFMRTREPHLARNLAVRVDRQPHPEPASPLPPLQPLARCRSRTTPSSKRSSSAAWPPIPGPRFRFSYPKPRVGRDQGSKMWFESHFERALSLRFSKGRPRAGSSCLADVYKPQGL